jgi:hypothetical protein
MKGLVRFTAMLVALVTLVGCSFKHESGNATSPAATATTAPPIATATAATAAPPVATAAGLNPATSQTISDGICSTLIPDAWTNSGNGRGFTASGARFILFGNLISGDSEWSAAVNIIATVAAGQGAKPHETAGSISYQTSDGTSFEIRRRINDRYCDFSVMSTSAASADEQAVWQGVGASMTAAPAAEATP